jgi:two-component system, LuxR family, response regulator FixJ
LARTLVAKKDVEVRIATFTDRERQVFELLVLGHSNGAVARDLDLAERTVELHRANVMTKMDAPNLSRLVRMALAVQGSEPS